MKKPIVISMIACLPLLHQSCSRTPNSPEKAFEDHLISPIPSEIKDLRIENLSIPGTWRLHFSCSPAALEDLVAKAGFKKIPPFSEPKIEFHKDEEVNYGAVVRRINYDRSTEEGYFHYSEIR